MLCVFADILLFRFHLLFPDDDFYNLTLHRDSVVRIAVYYLLFHFRIPVFCGITTIKSYGMDFVDFAAYLVSFSCCT